MSLLKGRYIGLYFDEFYVPQMSSYMNYHFMHSDLAYGFDDTKIYFLGIHKGKPIEFSLTYQEVIDGCKSSMDIDRNNTLTVYQFDPMDYSFNITALYKSLRDYLSGVIDNIEFYNVDKNNCVYNIKVLDKFINENCCLDTFMTDVRISYLLNEHTQLMRERVKYLINSEIININESVEIVTNLDYLCDKALVMQSLVIKYSIASNDKIKQNVL